MGYNLTFYAYPSAFCDGKPRNEAVVLLFFFNSEEERPHFPLTLLFPNRVPTDVSEKPQPIKFDPELFFGLSLSKAKSVPVRKSNPLLM